MRHGSFHPSEGEAAVLVLSGFAGSAGFVIHLISLNEQVAIKSATYGSVGANLGLAGAFFGVEAFEGFDLFLGAALAACVGLIGAVLLQEGQVERPEDTTKVQAVAESQ